jgi:hypothetical protein
MTVAIEGSQWHDRCLDKRSIEIKQYHPSPLRHLGSSYQQHLQVKGIRVDPLMRSEVIVPSCRFIQSVYRMLDEWEQKGL